SRDNPKRDWYVWRDGKDGDPPNNWYSSFGGPAWEYDPATGQYYYHCFFKQQPDLNWRNPQVKQALWDAVRFWLDLGVDGFRLDAIATIFEHPDLPDQPAEMSLLEMRRAFISAAAGSEEWERLVEQQKTMFQYQIERPGVHELMQELRTVVDEYSDRVLVGETGKIAYYGDGTNELHLAFNFPLMKTERITPAWVRANQQERLSALPPGAWPCNTLNNHDASRVYSRYGDGQNDAALARLHLALLLTLRGTPFLYNGEEIGMTDSMLEEISQFRDIPLARMYPILMEELGISPAEALAMANRMGRDKCRTPVQWDDAPNGGFSPAGVQTWLPVNPNYSQGINVTDQLADPDSLLNFYRRLLRVRKQTPALIAGDYRPLHEEAEDYLAFLRSCSEQTCLVVLNMSDQAHTLNFDGSTGLAEVLDAHTARPVFSSHTQGDRDDLSQLAIAPFEIYIAEIV
ncbi:MAG: alpha-glucosidase C-terminal domain-containing protein, partial [Anaerolineae bacterium]|nr:alpha-glucosidase C-terminal domain-containing protein [Anaerolineae bacterium]